MWLATSGPSAVYLGTCGVTGGRCDLVFLAGGRVQIKPRLDVLSSQLLFTSTDTHMDPHAIQYDIAGATVGLIASL